MEQKLDLRNFGGNLKRLVKQYNANHEVSFEKELDMKEVIHNYNLVYRYFSGTKRPSLDTLVEIADILGVSLEDLLS